MPMKQSNDKILIVIVMNKLFKDLNFEQIKISNRQNTNGQIFKQKNINRQNIEEKK